MNTVLILSKLNCLSVDTLSRNGVMGYRSRGVASPSENTIKLFVNNCIKESTFKILGF